MTKKIIQKSGFTLLETIIYLAIVGILLSSIIDFSITLGNSSSKMSANIDASRNRRAALSSVNYLVRNADGLWKDIYNDCSNFNSSPQILALYFNNDDYLPGPCVENGGGVKISIDEGRLKMTCYPNAGYNGSYNTCSSSAGNSYWLSGQEVSIANSALTFSTSTATSTANGFTSVTSYLNVSTISNNQTSLKANSAATSTVAVRNEQPNGLTVFYKFDDGSGNTAVDSIDGTSLSCALNPPASVGPLLTNKGSLKAFDFNSSESDYCSINNPEKFNLGPAFTISTWIKMDSPTAAPNEHAIINKHDWSSSRGYYLMVYGSTGRVIFRVCDGTVCSNILDVNSVLSNATVYNVTVVYDQPNSLGKMYIYQAGVGGVSTTTAASWPILVNASNANYPRVGNNLDGVLDDLRIYNRALTETEVWALQSQGAN